MRDDAQFAKDVEAAIERIEALTCVELVFVGRRQCGSYRDVELSVGIALTAVVLAVLVYCPVELHQELLLPVLAVTFALATLAVARVPAVRRPFCSTGRMRRQAEREARIHFVDESVAATRGRTGLLVFQSSFEDELVLLPDVGVASAIESSHLHRIVHQFRAAREAGVPATLRALAALDAIGTVVSGPLPPSAANPDELPNRPRFYDK
ncbi:MAG: hypothetical protein HY816_13720 [Candidatus Wallbacteria bacterium]|nr:hypothetical protein [Candidatus Wallbacteria bacterium]